MAVDDPNAVTISQAVGALSGAILFGRAKVRGPGKLSKTLRNRM